ncbi:MAG: hypothetical protein KBS86_03410 [Proteobacteria bacterium]|nr:hypothetical protein [Candidatus Enterousia scatequi]
MYLKEAVREYRKTKQATKIAMARVAESVDMISSDKAGAGPCFFNIRAESVVSYSKCLAMYGDVKSSPFCSGCKYKDRRIVYEQNQTALEIALRKEANAKRQLIKSLKNILVKSK